MSVQIKGVGTIGGIDQGLDTVGVVTATSFVGTGVSVVGVVTATSFSGSGANLTSLPAQATIANNADNRVITGGSGVNLNAEANLTFNSSLVVTDGNGTVTTGGNYINLKRTSATVNYINAPLADAELHISADENIVFKTVHTGDFNSTERARITSDGKLGINTATTNDSSELLCLTGPSGDNATIGIKCNSTTHAGILGFHDTAGTFRGRVQYSHNTDHMQFNTAGSERLRITSSGRIGINETSPDGMLHIKSNVPAIFLEDTDGTHGQAIIEQNGDILKIRQDAGNASSGTGSVIQFEVDGSAWAKVDTAFGLKADNTCKTWLCYRSEAGNEGIIDDFNVASVNDEGTGSFAVTLDRNIHRHGNGWSQSIVFGCYNDGSRPLIAGVGYAPSHGSNNPWWDVEDNFVRVNTQRSTDGVKVDAKVFNLAMFGDTGDLNPT